MTRTYAAALTALLVLTLPAFGADWPQWRGPAFNGSSLESGLPADWNATNRLRWVADLPGAGSSTPVISGDRVYLPCWDPKSNRLMALGLDADTGRELWRYDAGPGFKPKGGNTAASPSAAADGQRVFFLFGTGLFVALDRDGKPLWKRYLAKQDAEMGAQFGYSSSPLLYEGKLFISILRESERPSCVTCIDPANGYNLWSQDRLTDAVAESRDAYTTPCPFEAGGTSLVVVAGGDCITAQDAATGREAWRSADFNPDKNERYRLIPTPTPAGQDIVCSVNRGTLLLSLRGAGAGQLGEAGWRWKVKEWASDISSPLYYRERLFALAGERKRIACLEPASGKALWSGDLGTRGNFFSSPTAADGRIYCASLAGEVVVLSAGPAFQILHKVDFGETGSGASVAIARRSLFIRTHRRLYCIGN